jgi:hypothetical protein
MQFSSMPPPSLRVVFVGHSTGGAVAAVVAYKLWKNADGLYPEWAKKIERGGVVTFGSPRHAVARDPSPSDGGPARWRWHSSPPDSAFQANVALVRVKVVGDPVASVPASIAKSVLGAQLAREAEAGFKDSPAGSVDDASGFGRLFEEEAGRSGSEKEQCDGPCGHTVHLARFCDTGQVCVKNKCESERGRGDEAGSGAGGVGSFLEQGTGGALATSTASMPVIESVGPLAQWRKTVDTSGFCGEGWQFMLRGLQ